MWIPIPGKDVLYLDGTLEELTHTRQKLPWRNFVWQAWHLMIKYPMCQFKAFYHAITMTNRQYLKSPTHPRQLMFHRALWRLYTRAALTPKYPQPPRSVYGTTWSYCETVILWNSLCDDFSNFSSRVPIPHWLCILHVHWCRDCETVPEQHWNKPGTVSQSQCTPPQFKQIIFGIKNESEVQGQSSSEFTWILTVLKCICGPNLEILTWICDE